MVARTYSDYVPHNSNLQVFVTRRKCIHWTLWNETL